ncbi:laminin subunit alpha-2 [Caerostris extrusa]|uniref:Laminin subunit alpha-2 n=1 Tax=Caerostris extrusa TaxID=172846 RepID=A0AAV4XHR9_CAEEX|nr:laminin subunit alpha-2 [Caerostris extrusa]
MYTYRKGLFPSVHNLAANAIISANATCGESGPEVYCKLVEHVFMREPQCGLCDARSDNAEHRHPIINSIDGTNKWWQSPTLQNGKHFEWVTITLDLKQELYHSLRISVLISFQIAYVIVKSAISPRPGNWILEKSLDGLIYKPWQYYAINDAECWEAFGVPPTMGKPRYRSDDEVICTSYYSKLNPLEGGIYYCSICKVEITKIRTLNADLMTMQSHDPSKIDKSTTRRHHTTGINCEQCEDGYYRPLGVERSDPTPCRRCRCAGPGVTGFCIKDDSFILEGIYPGDCICKKGFLVPNVITVHWALNNILCVSLVLAVLLEQRVKQLVKGIVFAKKMLKGLIANTVNMVIYNMDAENSDGCTPCYCSGITNRCQKKMIGIQSLNGWRVSDIYGLHIVDPEYEGDYLRITNEAMLGFDNYYWMAPPEYIGKKRWVMLYSYGGDLRYVIGYTVIEDDGVQSDAPGIILESDSKRIGYYFGSRKVQGNITVTLPLQERAWSHLTAAGKRSRAVTKETFAVVMNNITRLLIRAKYHSDQIIGVLYNVEMEIADRWSSSIKKMQTVEMCECPLGYSGLSCEICEPGYRRLNDTLHKGICELCECNGHAGSCDPYTGYCINCDHNTTGHYCERCVEGFHGNPYRGTSEDCQPCACPLLNPQNNFSPICKDIVTTDGVTDYVCTACPNGYTGSKCERCAHGYFGTPGIPDGSCQPCDCTGNADTSNPNFCDHITGQCLKCIGNTGGWNCNECLEGHYGNAYHHVCKPCGCSPLGSESSICDRATGVCECKPKFVGRECDRCDSWDVFPCRCNKTGTKGGNIDQCDPVTGKCDCKPGVFGLKCDTCLEGYYSFSEKGCICEPCENSAHICDPITGSCACPPNTEGDFCQRCTSSSWGHDPIQGCTPCNCNTRGSVPESVCDVANGNCLCLEGYEGRSCDKCRFAYYHFPNCLECKCRHDGTSQCTVEGLCQCDEDGQCPCKIIPRDVMNVFALIDQFLCKQAEMVWSQTRSYNGVLKISIESRSSRRYPDPLLFKYPLIILEGNARSIVHSPFLPISGGKYSVRLHETEDVSMEIAVPISPTPASPYVAVGIEICDCPREYGGLSCQVSIGKRKLNFENSTDLFDPIGISVPCPCNGRSETCDPETGHCLLEHFVTCVQKASFGDPKTGSCHPCKCPLVDNRCSQGYYGVPTMLGGNCLPCNCNPIWLFRSSL